MTTASDTTYTLNRDQLIQTALVTLGARYPGEGVDTATMSYCSNMLNNMVLAWQALDLHLWLETEATLFLQQGQNQYAFTNTTSGDHCTNSYVETTLSASAATSATTVTLTSVTGMSVSDNIGIILDSGLTFWTTISAINTGTKVVTLASALTSSATSGNYVHTYTSKIYRPLRIWQARRYQYNGATDLVMHPLSRPDYFALPFKTNLGDSVQYYYDPQLTTGQFYVWPKPTDSSYAVKFTYDRPLFDFLNASDTPDLPSEWYEPIVWNLATRLGPFCGKTQKAQELAPQAQQMLQQLLSFDREKTSNYLGISN